MMRASLLVVAGLAALLIGGCAKGDFKEKASQGSGNVLRYPLNTVPTTLDPGVVQDGDTIDALQQVYEGLVTWGEDNQPKPLLAEKWDIEDGGKTYVFTIKKGVKFHNGRELKAEDFKWSWERACSSDLASETISAYLGDVVGLMDMKNGKADSISGVTVVDDYTLKVEIDKPRPYFLGKLTYLVSAVVAKEALDGKSEIRNVQQMVGTGPFKATSYEPAQMLKLAANEDYHGGRPALDAIERPVITDSATRLNKYRTGELDLCLLQRQDVKGIQEDPKFASHLTFYSRPSIYYVGINVTGKDYAAFKDIRVRQAIAMAIDRERIAKDILGGINEPAYSIVPPGVLGHREKGAFIPYDPVKAKQLLAEAGYPDGKGLPPVEFRFRDGQRDVSLVAEEIVSQLKANLNLTLNPRITEWKAYLERYNKGQNAIYHMRWAADYLDPQNFLSHMLATGSPENHHGYSNPRFDALCAEADALLDNDKRLPLYAEAEDIALQDATWIPIYFQRDAELINPRVKGLRESLFGHLPHTTVRLEK